MVEESLFEAIFDDCIGQPCDAAFSSDEGSLLGKRSTTAGRTTGQPKKRHCGGAPL